jgi:EAL domain-containing protein (putative c-di-GMP-specific phosphodiesterase class I)
VPIGRWVLHEAGGQARAWQSHGLFVVSVNLSARQFQRADLIDDVRTALRTSGLPARALKLDITGLPS